jgi:hypothetical protein
MAIGKMAISPIPIGAMLMGQMLKAQCNRTNRFRPKDVKPFFVILDILKEF